MVTLLEVAAIMAVDLQTLPAVLMVLKVLLVALATLAALLAAQQPQARDPVMVMLESLGLEINPALCNYE